MQLAKYRAALPQTGDRLFMTDGGLETTLIFHERVVLREGSRSATRSTAPITSDSHASSARLRNLRCARRGSPDRRPWSTGGMPSSRTAAPH